MYSQVALSFIKFGGDKRDRTADLLHAISENLFVLIATLTLNAIHTIFS